MVFALPARVEADWAEVAACALVKPVVSVVGCKELSPIQLHHPFAVKVHVERLRYPADGEQNARCPAARGFSVRAEGAPFPAESARQALSYPDGVAAQWGQAVGSCNVSFEVHAADPRVEDNDLLCNAADKAATGQAADEHDDPSCPSPFCAAPNHGPNVRPNAAALQTTN